MWRHLWFSCHVDEARAGQDGNYKVRHIRCDCLQINPPRIRSILFLTRVPGSNEMVSSRRYALVALVVSCKANARSMLQPTTEPQPQETYQAGPSPTIAAIPHDHLALLRRATTSPIQLHTCGYLYGDASTWWLFRSTHFCLTSLG